MIAFVELLKNILNELRSLTPPPSSDIPLQITQTLVTIATTVRPQDADVIANIAAGQPGYDVISVFNEKKKLANKIWLINDGPGTLFVIASGDGERFTGEGDLLKNESRAFTQVFELRVRSPNALTQWRLSEFEPGFML